MAQSRNRSLLLAAICLLGPTGAGATIATTCADPTSCSLAELLGGAAITIDGVELGSWSAPFNEIRDSVPDPFGGHTEVVGELDTQAIQVVPSDSDPLGPALIFLGNGALDLVAEDSWRGFALVLDFDLTVPAPFGPIGSASLALTSFTTPAEGTIDLSLDGCPLGAYDCDEPDDFLDFLSVHSAYATSATVGFAPRRSATFEIDIFASLSAGQLTLDEFRVGLGAVPEPGIALLLGGALPLLLLCRGRREGQVRAQPQRATSSTTAAKDGRARIASE